MSPHKSASMSDITWQASLQKTSRHYAIQFGAVVGTVRRWGDGWTCSLGGSGRFGKFGPLFPTPEKAKEHFEKNWPADLDAERRLGGES